jgi:hypothetical protein
MTGWWRYSALIAAPAAWAVSMQAGQILPYVDCDRHGLWTPSTALLAAAIALLAAALSLAGRRQLAGTYRFVASLAGLVALVFGFALLLQSAATVILDPCLR